MSVLAPALVGGNAVVLVASEARPLPAVTLAEVLATSDVPAGVVNVLTGRPDELTIEMWRQNIHAQTMLSIYKPNVDLLILDGIPRSVRQAELLKSHVDVLGLVYLECSNEEAMIHRIRRRLLSCGEREVSSRLIGEWVMEELRRLDQVAYVRFASVYRKFEDVNAFREEIERLEREPPPEMQTRQMDLLQGGEEKK